MPLTIELEQEVDGRWIADVIELSGVMVYGETREAALTRVKALAERVLADQMESGFGIGPALGRDPRRVPRQIV